MSLVLGLALGLSLQFRFRFRFGLRFRFRFAFRLWFRCRALCCSAILCVSATSFCVLLSVSASSFLDLRRAAGFCAGLAVRTSTLGQHAVLGTRCCVGPKPARFERKKPASLGNKTVCSWEKLVRLDKSRLGKKAAAVPARSEKNLPLASNIACPRVLLDLLVGLLEKVLAWACPRGLLGATAGLRGGQVG